MLAEETAADPVLRTQFESIAALALNPDDLYCDDEDTSAVTEQQVEAVRTSDIGRMLLRMNAVAQQTRMTRGLLLTLVVRFYAANGMRQRFPRRRRTNDETEIQYLANLRLWRSPALVADGGREGPNSLQNAHKDELLAVASEFFDTRCRCIWFERMLVEAIVATEVYTLREEWRSNPFLSTGRQTIVWTALVSFAYESSKGISPRYDIYLWFAWLVYVLCRVALIAGLGIAAVYLVDKGQEIWGYLTGIAAAILAMNLIGQYVVRKIAWWAAVARGDAATARGDTAGLLQRALSAHFQVSQVNMNPHLVREMLTACVSRGLGIDPIVFSYLDRAIASGEARWAPHD